LPEQELAVNRREDFEYAASKRRNPYPRQTFFPQESKWDEDNSSITLIFGIAASNSTVQMNHN
jgi:hypothetical protein